MSPRRLYFDNAATSFPKPPGVTEAMVHFATHVGGTAGRGNYHEAREGARIIRQCRQRLCTLFNGESPDHFIFTLNGTDALNLAIKGLLSHRRRTEPGRPIHLIASALEHNSILRPFNTPTIPDIEWTRIPADPATGTINPRDIQQALRPDTLMVALIHASNVTGIVQPVADVGAVCREAGVPFLVDAAQSAGHIPIDVRAMNIDLLAFPGHKGLLGPLGTGVLYLRPGMEERIDPLREGGTGSQSELDTQPQTLPDKYEPGSHNAIGIAGLSAALAWILDRGQEHWAHERQLIDDMLESLTFIGALGTEAGRGGLRLVGPAAPDNRVGVFSLVHDSLGCHELAAILEQEYGVLARAGLHCAPCAHAALGTSEAGGALRLSLGPFLSTRNIADACQMLSTLCRELTAHAEN